MRRIFLVFLLFSTQVYSQESIFFADNENDYIPPSHLVSPFDSSKKASFFLGSNGIGSDLYELRNPIVMNYYDVYGWGNEAYYVDRFQFNIKASVGTSYELFNKWRSDFNNFYGDYKLLIGYYFQFYPKNSYLNNSMRFQIGLNDFINIYTPLNKSNSFDYEFIYGGNLAPPKLDLIEIVQLEINKFSNSGSTYDITGYHTLKAFRKSKNFEGIEIYYDLARNSYKNIDKWYSLEIGVVTRISDRARSRNLFIFTDIEKEYYTYPNTIWYHLGVFYKFIGVFHHNFFDFDSDD